MIKLKRLSDQPILLPKKESVEKLTSLLGAFHKKMNQVKNINIGGN